MARVVPEPRPAHFSSSRSGSTTVFAVEQMRASRTVLCGGVDLVKGASDRQNLGPASGDGSNRITGSTS
jgi:hypothetical protein